jgi:hypothetical protein
MKWDYGFASAETLRQAGEDRAWYRVAQQTGNNNNYSHTGNTFTRKDKRGSGNRPRFPIAGSDNIHSRAIQPTDIILSCPE